MKLDNADLNELERRYRALEADALATLAHSGVSPGAASIERSADGRFVGQGFYLSVPLPAGPYTDHAVLRAAFEKGYREKFTNTPPQVTIEFVNIRVTVCAPAPGQTAQAGAFAASPGKARSAARKVYFKESAGLLETAVYRREHLTAQFAADGPLLIEEEGSTLVVAPGGRVSLAASGNLIVEIA